MKYGHELLLNQHAPWASHYLNYNSLKRLLNEIVNEKQLNSLLARNCSTRGRLFTSITTESAALNQDDHSGLPSFQTFIRRLNENITKIHAFYSETRHNLTAEVDFYTLKFQFLAESRAAEKSLMEVGDNIMISSTTSTDSSNHRMLKIALAAYDCYLNCIRLKQYVVINTTGVRKILKKHDKQTLGNPTLLQDHSNTPQFISNLLYKLDLAQLDAIIEKLDHLCLKYQMFGTLTMTEKMKLEGLNLLKPTRRLPFDIMDKENFIIDMDGVIYHGTQLLPGVKTFISWLKRENKKFLFLTNSSDKTPAMLKAKLDLMGIEVSEDHFYTSALSTARFLAQQHPEKGGRVFAMGEEGLIKALENEGFLMVEDGSPVDYVVVGETGNDAIYNYSQLKKAINYLNPTRTPGNFGIDSSHVPASSSDSIDKLFNNSPRLNPSMSTGLGMDAVMNRPRFIATNCDTVDRALPYGWSPSVGSLVASIEVATGLKAYYLGKPNPLMMTSALSKLGGLRSQTVIIGDRMDTDIIGGIEAGIETILVLSGVTVLSDLDKFPYRPSYVLGGVNELGQIIYASTPSRRLDQFAEFSPTRI